MGTRLGCGGQLGQFCVQRGDARFRGAPAATLGWLRVPPRYNRSNWTP